MRRKSLKQKGFGIANWNSQFRRAGQKFPRDGVTAEITHQDSTRNCYLASLKWCGDVEVPLGKVCEEG